MKQLKWSNRNKGGLLPMLLVALAASIFGNALEQKGVMRAGENF